MWRNGCVRSSINQLINRHSVLLISFILSFVTVSMGRITDTIIQGYEDENDHLDLKTFTFISADGEKGEFSSPDFPNPYKQNVRARYHFRAAPDEVVWITWKEFVLEEPFSANGLCMRDYVEIIVIDYHNVQHVSGRYCGTNKPPEFKTMQQSVDIIFQSSYISSKQYRGFVGNFTFKHERELPPPPSRYPDTLKPHGCGGISVGFGGVIQSPGYPEAFPENIECNWVIRVEPGKRVYVRILELQLSGSKECAGAQLSVIDGYAHFVYENNTRPQEKYMVQFCGEEKYYKDQGARSYMSTRNRMVVRFTTTKTPPQEMKDKRAEYGSPIGFYLVWTEVLPLDSDNAMCDKFLCRGGDYCLDETQTVCAERRRYCIDKSLLCDGIPNCGELDESDEENCYSKEIVAAGASLFLLLVLIIVAVICCQRGVGRKHLRRIRRTTSHTSSMIGNAPVNANNINVDTPAVDHLQRVSFVNKSSANSTRKTDIAAFPHNYHPAREPADFDHHEERPKPFLAVPNHVPATSIPVVTVKKSMEQVGRCEDGDSKERTIQPAASNLRRRQGSINVSTTHPSTCVPLIKVAAEGKSAPNEQPVVYPQGACPIHNRPASAQIKWTYDPTVQDQGKKVEKLEKEDVNAAAVEMITFSASSSSNQRSSSQRAQPTRPLGILKSTPSLPSSSDQRSYSSVGTVNITGHAAAKNVSVPAPPPPPLVQKPEEPSSSKPPPPSYSQAIARLGRQKAVEFADELPRRHDEMHQQQPSIPPLMLAPPGTRVGNNEDDPNEDRSPSPWHRLKPSIV